MQIDLMENWEANTIPSRRGPVAVPSATITGSGQLRFNTRVTNDMTAEFPLAKSEVKKLYLGSWNTDTREITFSLNPFPGQDPEKGIPSKYMEDGNNIYAGFGPALRQVGYDFQKSGDQTFDVKVELGIVTLKIPEGSLTPREVKHRAPKEKKETPDSTSSVAAPVQEAELVEA